MQTQLLNRGLLALGLSLTLAGCASMQQVSADVASFGDWPAGRAPGTYAFDRMPSQQARADDQQVLEDALRPALERAGFRPAPAGSEPDVLVQTGARVTRTDYSPWDDPLWWHGGFGTWRQGPWRGPAWGWTVYSPMAGSRYDREAAVLLRDRASGKPLYEARASSQGYSQNAGPLLGPLFAAALAEFPATKAEPHRVTVPATTTATP